MRIYSTVLLILSLYCFNTTIACADSQKVMKPVVKALKGTSSWQNQSGSTMIISVSSSGRISGQYINREANYQCRDTPYPLKGWVLGTAISFTVQWTNAFENCNSVTGWTGFYDPSSQKIITKWNLGVSGSTDPSQIVDGKDEFTQMGTKINASLLN